jgi:hypothetical protein
MSVQKTTLTRTLPAPTAVCFFFRLHDVDVFFARGGCGGGGLIVFADVGAMNISSTTSPPPPARCRQQAMGVAWGGGCWPSR